MSVDTTIREVTDKLRRKNAGPIYLQIAHEIRSKILRGELVPGELLPTQQRLAALLGVGQITVRRALRELAIQGLAHSRQGSGTLICDHRASRIPRRHNDANPINIVFSETGDGYPFLHPVVEAVKRLVNVQPRLVHLGMTEHHASYIEDRTQLHATCGLILNSPVSTTLVAACIRLDVPYVMLFNELIDGVSPCLTVDYGPGLTDALGHLRSHGRQRIVLMTPESDRFSAGRLSELFLALLGAHRLPVQADTIIPAGYHLHHGYAATIKLLDTTSRPDAIIYSSDYQALGGLHAARDRGVNVPGELSIIGAGRLAGGLDWPARLSTIDLNLDALAACAIEMLMHPRGQPRTTLRRSVRSAFVAGETS